MVNKAEVNERIRAAFREVCDGVYEPYEAGEPMKVSSYFRNEMQELLQQERGWSYSRRKKLWLIAAVAAMLLLLTSAVLLVKPADPDQGEHGTIVSRPEAFIATDFEIAGPVTELTERYTFSTIPEGFVEKTDDWRKDFSMWEWTCEGTVIRLEQECSVTSEALERLRFSWIQPAEVNGTPAYMYRKSGTIKLKWVTENYQLCLQVMWTDGNESVAPEQVIQWAESLVAEPVQWYEEPLPDDT
ncbi:MAG: hypothetical protein IJY28_02305 [Clostridia bacterium]|nr:hypothetical protein [Clostridia bacterium]